MDSLGLITDQDDRSREEQLHSNKMHLKTFCDNQQPPHPGNVHKKQRSHSRGNSIASLDEIFKPTSMIPSPPRSRPSSHHRRQSSLSSRRASAEIMGIALPEDDKSSVPDYSRLHALLALEGKNSSPISSPFGFSKVELPDLSATAAEPKVDLAVASGTGIPRTNSLSSNNPLTGKRESFGKLLTPASSCSKKELHTLLEEDEGDDEEGVLDEPQYIPPAPSPLPPSPLPQRHRPASLKLRPLSLRSVAALPTPSPTPPMRNSAKLKSLTLASTAVVVQATALGPPKRSSAVVAGGSPMLSTIELDTSLQRSNSVGRRKQDNARPGLLTPAASSSSLTRSPSPRFDAGGRSPSPGRSSASSPDDAHAAYLIQSHTSLLARIAELENALTLRDDRSEPALAEPLEELLEMLADLKTERDGLKKELDDEHTKTAEHERRATILNRRVDNERREVWVTKEKLAIAEAASKVIEEERDELRDQVKKLNNMLSALKSDLLRERKEKAKVEAELREVLRTPKVTDLMSNTSTDSQTTNVEASPLDTQLKRIPKNAGMGIVSEEDENYYGDAHSDGSFHSRSASFASDARSPVPAYGTEGPTYQPYQIPARHDSLNNEWSFAKAASAPRRCEPKKELDLFFTCLENLDCDEPGFAKPLVEVQTPTRQPKVLGHSFGFDLLEDEDPNFNFGQPVDDKPFSFHQPEREEPQEDVGFATQTETNESRPPAPLPFLDDEDSAFSFGASQDSSVASRSPSPDLEEAGLITPRFTPPQWSGAPVVFPVAPATERQHTRPRSRVSRDSVDLSSTSWAFPKPKSAPPNITAFPQSKPQALPPVPTSVPTTPTVPTVVVPTAPAAKVPSFAPPSKKPFSFGRSATQLIPSRIDSAPNPRPPVMLTPPSPGPMVPSQPPYYRDARVQPCKSTQTLKSGLFANLASLLPSSWTPRS